MAIQLNNGGLVRSGKKEERWIYNSVSPEIQVVKVHLITDPSQLLEVAPCILSL